MCWRSSLEARLQSCNVFGTDTWKRRHLVMAYPREERRRLKLKGRPAGCVFKSCGGALWAGKRARPTPYLFDPHTNDALRFPALELGR
jgi:hypothetical protein